MDKNSILEDSTGRIIPVAPNNTDYKRYLKWISSGNVPTTTDDSIYDVASYQEVPEKWTKDGEADSLTKPMIPERWSDGITTVYSAEEVPTELDEEGNEIVDPDFVYFPETADNSWAYVPKVNGYWELVLKDSYSTQQEAQAIQNIVRSAINFGQQLMVEFASENMAMGITQAGMTKQVRQAMQEVMNAMMSGSLYDAIEETKAVQFRDSTFITDERLLQYVNKIETYLGTTLSEDLGA